MAVAKLAASRVDLIKSKNNLLFRRRGCQKSEGPRASERTSGEEEGRHEADIWRLQEANGN